MINLPAELGWISKNLPLGPRAFSQVFTDPLLLCWQVHHRPNTGYLVALIVCIQNPGPQKLQEVREDLPVLVL